MIIRLVTLTVICLTCGVLLWDWRRQAQVQIAEGPALDLTPGEIEVTVLAPPRGTVPENAAVPDRPRMPTLPDAPVGDKSEPVLFELAGTDPETPPVPDAPAVETSEPAPFELAGTDPETPPVPDASAIETSEPALFERADGDPEAPRPLDELVEVTPTSTPVDPIGSAVSGASPVPPMMLFVTGDQVNLRAEPTTSSRVLTRLKRGDAVVLMGDPGGGWLEIRAIRGGAQGFMSIDFLSPEDPR